MDNYPLKPENMRVPEHLTKGEVQKSLDELDNKIKTLKARVNATTADSNHTYHEHIAGLERKRELILQKMGDPNNNEQHWSDLHKNIGNLHNDADGLMK
ncbi:sll1863 family stress response protein [Pontibacter chinhatensis]|uniref:Uncharacterized protein n=1 Tax=Pontibacter chinhatensis TaxID=1436961 RepID=A0A1I2P0Q6_9BACT|nr:hypothetical protein [Pontibacter chinhatensis]SFG09732.1 hypothetical protein SAMN05421739_101903 [Pontibacter chinhatensis]